MELNEAVRRIVGQHWRLIVLCLIVGVSGAVFLNASKVRTYTATTRVTLDTQDPRSRSEAMAIADTARAIATSPTQVALALVKAGIGNRDATKVAKNRVTVSALGASGIIKLSVSDRSPQIAAAIANALTARLIQARLEVTTGQVQQTLTDLDGRITDLNRRIADLDAKINGLDVDIATTTVPGRASSLRSERGDAARSRDFLAQQRVSFESERASLRAAQALRPKPSIISTSSVPSERDPYHWSPIIILGAILGLILGIALAGLSEMIRPTLVGGDALAGELKTQLLGTLAQDPWVEPSPRELTGLAIRVRFASEAAGVSNVGLLPTVDHVLVGRLAVQLNATLADAGFAVEDVLEEAPSRLARVAASSGAESETVATVRASGSSRRKFGSAKSAPEIRVRQFDLEDSSPWNGNPTGLVLVSPAVLKKDELTDIGRLLDVMRMPILGLIAFTPKRSRMRRRLLEGLSGIGGRTKA
jgi:hypothetical protein